MERENHINHEKSFFFFSSNLIYGFDALAGDRFAKGMVLYWELDVMFVIILTLRNRFKVIRKLHRGLFISRSWALSAGSDKNWFSVSNNCINGS